MAAVGVEAEVARVPAAEAGLPEPPARVQVDEAGLPVPPVLVLPALVRVLTARPEAASVRLELPRVQGAAAVAEPGLLAAQREQAAAAAAELPLAVAVRRC